MLVSLSPVIDYLKSEGVEARRYDGTMDERGNLGCIFVTHAGLTVPVLLDSDNAVLDSSLGHRTGPQFYLSDPNVVQQLKTWMEKGAPGP